MAPESLGRYQVQDEIGEGTIARVYRAFDPEVGRVVAVKTIRSERLSPSMREAYLARFRREAEAAARLAHPNIVGVFDVAEDFLVMELVRGQTLEEMIKPGPLDLEPALGLLTPVADAIDHAHQAGVVHGDIKPGNIMVEADGRPRLMGFGVPRLEPGELSASASSAGSPSYLAPELFGNGEVTHAADLFSFAVVAYETMTGHRPFKGDTVATIVRRIIHENPPSPRSWNRSLPRAYEAVFARALAKDPARRFESALAFIAALEQERLNAASSSLETVVGIPVAAVAPEPVSAAEEAPRPDVVRPTGTQTLPPAPLRPRAPWLPWLIAAASLVALAVNLLWSQRRPAAPPPSVPPTAAPTRAELVIESEPEGASVWVDGALAGTAPLTLKDPAPGPHQVRVLRDGFAPAELGLEIKDGTKSPPLRFVMSPVGAPLKIESLPEGATVLVDGHAVEGPLERLVLDPGTHEVRLEAKGFRPQVERVTAEAGRPVAIAARLEPAPTPSPRPRRASSPPTTTPPPAATLAAEPLPPSPPAVTRGALVAVDDTVTPPRRVSGEPAPYPEDARKLSLRGSVLVEFIVSEDGEPEDIQVLESAGVILDRAVVTAVERWRFSPAVKDGEQVKVRWKYKQTFLPAP